jgi:membrane-bound metal-dependent hydrolase YbcI (DUF457 family)
MFLYFKDKRRIDPLALAVSTTFIDLEPLYYMLLGEPLDHRVWHGFTLALTIYLILVTIGVCILERLFENKLLAFYKWARLKPVKARYPLRNIYLLSLFGGFSHVVLDMFTIVKCFGCYTLYEWESILRMASINNGGNCCNRVIHLFLKLLAKK